MAHQEAHVVLKWGASGSWEQPTASNKTGTSVSQLQGDKLTATTESWEAGLPPVKALMNLQLGWYWESGLWDPRGTISSEAEPVLLPDRHCEMISWVFPTPAPFSFNTWVIFHYLLTTSFLLQKLWLKTDLQFFVGDPPLFYCSC